MGLGEQPSIRREKGRIVAKRRFYPLTDVAFGEAKSAFGEAKSRPLAKPKARIFFKLCLKKIRLCRRQRQDFSKLCLEKSSAFFQKAPNFLGARRARDQKIWRFLKKSAHFWDPKMMKSRKNHAFCRAKRMIFMTFHHFLGPKNAKFAGPRPSFFDFGDFGKKLN